MKVARKILRQIVDDLADKVANDPDRVEGTRFSVQWTIMRMRRDGVMAEEIKPSMKEYHTGEHRKMKQAFKEEDEDKVKEEMVVEKQIRAEMVEDEDDDGNLRKFIKVNMVHDNLLTSTKMLVNLLDRLSPTVIKLGRTIAKANALQVDRNMSFLDKAYAKVRSDRIDDILLGKGEKDGQKN
jgi:hypothetical protein